MPRIESAIRDPHLYYRLDPGEPGLLRSAKASQSAMAVSAQERRNLQRLKSEAAMRGEQVVFADIRYTYGRDGSFSSVRAGQTTVVSRKQGADPLASGKDPEAKLKEVEEPAPPNAEEAEEGFSQEVQSERVRLVIEQRRLEEELSALRIQEKKETEPWKVQEIQRKERQIEEQLRILEEEIRGQAQEDVSRRIGQLQGAVAYALRSQGDVFSRVLALRFGRGGAGQGPGSPQRRARLLDVRA